MSVRAKIRINSIEKFVGQSTLKASPVTGTAGDNADYSRYTPSGQITLTISDETKAATYFEVGKEYVVTFEAAPTP